MEWKAHKYEIFYEDYKKKEDFHSLNVLTYSVVVDQMHNETKWDCRVYKNYDEYIKFNQRYDSLEEAKEQGTIKLISLLKSDSVECLDKAVQLKSLIKENGSMGDFKNELLYALRYFTTYLALYFVLFFVTKNTFIPDFKFNWPLVLIMGGFGYSLSRINKK